MLTADLGSIFVFLIRVDGTNQIIIIIIIIIQYIYIALFCFSKHSKHSTLWGGVSPRPPPLDIPFIANHVTDLSVDQPLWIRIRSLWINAVVVVMNESCLVIPELFCSQQHTISNCNLTDYLRVTDKQDYTASNPYSSVHLLVRHAFIFPAALSFPELWLLHKAVKSWTCVISGRGESCAESSISVMWSQDYCQSSQTLLLLYEGFQFFHTYIYL